MYYRWLYTHTYIPSGKRIVLFKIRSRIVVGAGVRRRLGQVRRPRRALSPGDII